MCLDDFYYCNITFYVYRTRKGTSTMIYGCGDSYYYNLCFYSCGIWKRA